MSTTIKIRAIDCEIRELDVEARTVTGYVSTSAVDRYQEIVEPRGAQLDNYRRNPVVLLNHNWYANPIGKNLWIKTDKTGIVAKTQFAKTPLADEVFSLIQDGCLRAFSIGFMPLKWEDADLTAVGYRRRFTEWELLEYSVVTVPANPDALMNALSVARHPVLRDALEHQRSEQDAHRQIEELRASITELATRVDSDGGETAADRIEQRLVELSAAIENMASRIDTVESTRAIAREILDAAGTEVEHHDNQQPQHTPPPSAAPTTKRIALHRGEVRKAVAGAVAEALSGHGVRIRK